MIGWLATASPASVDIPGGWVTVIVALLASVLGPAITIVLTARMSGKVKSLKADSKATRYQVENNHSTNFREESDERHDETVTLLRNVIATQKLQSNDIGGIREELRALRTDDHDQRDRIHELEKTQPRPKKERP